VSRNDTDQLTYARDSIERIERWTTRGRDAILADEVLFEAVLHRLETLSDAVSHFSDPLKQRHPEIPWRSIAAFRNRLAHGYLDVNPERVWDVIEINLPALKTVVDEELDRPSSP
jgi:uncharacterized protein with HEPN domain